MEGLSFGAFVMYLTSFLQWIAKHVLSVILFMIALNAIVPLLPDDPFRSDILSISGTFEQWADLINWCIPTGFIVTSSLFAVECKIFFIVYHFLMDRLGVNFFAEWGSSQNSPWKWYNVE